MAGEIKLFFITEGRAIEGFVFWRIIWGDYEWPDRLGKTKQFVATTVSKGYILASKSVLFVCFFLGKCKGVRSGYSLDLAPPPPLPSRIIPPSPPSTLDDERQLASGENRGENGGGRALLPNT